MTSVKILREREDTKTRMHFENVSSAFEAGKGVTVHFEEPHERYGKHHMFIGFELVAVGR